MYNDIFVVIISENKDSIVWHYNCVYDEKENMLVCMGEGKKSVILLIHMNCWKIIVQRDSILTMIL